MKAAAIEPASACHRIEGGGGPERHRSNLLLVTVTSLDPRAFDGAWRSELETPSLDSLTATAIVFPNATALSAGTDAEVATVLTGLHPRPRDLRVDLRSGRDGRARPDSARGRVLHGRLLGRNADVREHPGFQRGFDAFVAPTKEESWEFQCPNGEVLDAALEWLRAREAEHAGPWLCWIHVGVPRVARRPELSPPQRRSLPRDLDPAIRRRILVDPVVGDFGDVETVFELRDRLGLVALDEDLADLVAFVQEHRAGGARERHGRVATVMTALQGGGSTRVGEQVLEPLLRFRVPLLVAGAEWTEARTDVRPATLADVMPTLVSRASPGALAPTCDGQDLLTAKPDTIRLIVLDRLELGEPASTAVRVGDATVGISDMFEGLAFVGDDPWHDATQEPPPMRGG